jgi:hypothetical protein
MAERADSLRIDGTGTVHPVGREASQELRAHSGEWRLLPSPRDAILLRRAGTGDGAAGAVLRLAGEIRTPGALCDVVALIAQSGFGGELVAIAEEGQRTIYFDGGNVVGAQTTVPEERLGETLYRFGVVTREQLEEAIKATATNGKRLGETAIELEFVTAEELYPMMARQVEEVFFRALHITEGIFYFFDRYDEKDLVRRHDLNAGALLMEAARRMDELKFFREKIPSSTYVPNPTGTTRKVPDDLALVYVECDGKRSVAEIGRRIGQLEFEVTRAVFQLMQGGFLAVSAPRPVGPEAIVEAFDRALLEVHKRCDAAGKGDELREGLSRFATGAGIYDPLFMGAGPQPDGTVRPDRVARNVAALAGDEPDAWLVQQLYEYTGFALFHAGSLLPRDVETQLNAKVAEILKPLRQTEAAPPSSSAEVGSVRGSNAPRAARASRSP